MPSIKHNLKTLQQYTYHILEGRHQYKSAGYIVDAFLVLLIIANVISVVLESEASLYHQYQSFFYHFELFSVFVFMIEYLLRLWCITANPDNTFGSVKARLKWMRSPIAIIDLIAILPFILQLFAVDLRFLRLMRLLRVLKLSRYSVALHMLMKVLGREKNTLQAVLVILVVLIVFAASGIYLVEHDVQPEAFGSIPKSMWWAVVTLTTVGYGDVTPITSMGKLFGACITILGIGLAALPAGILANGFATELANRRKRLEQKFEDYLLENRIDLNHTKKIEEIRKAVGLEKELAHDIVHDLLREQALQEKKYRLQGRHHNHCPHCGGKIEEYF